MAFGQIDPARLDGDALKRWYLRSPADLEEERQRAASHAYNAFFSQPDEDQPDSNPRATSVQSTGVPSDTDLLWRQVGPNRFRSDRAAPDSAPTAADDSGGYQLAAATFPPWGRLPILGCANCHDPQSGALLPNGPTPPPPIHSPRSSGAGGYRPDGGDKKECEQQRESDSKICGRLPYPEYVAICRGTASERYAYCRRRDGTIGFPQLETKGGRRP